MSDIQPEQPFILENGKHVTALTPDSIGTVKSNTAEQTTSLPLGKILAQQRELLGYTIEFVANYLKLSPRKIQKLEANEWDAFPSGPFVSGFIRSYARLLQLKEEDLVALLPETISNQSKQASEVFQGSTFRSAAGIMPVTNLRPSWQKWMFAGVLTIAITIILAFIIPEDAGKRLHEWSTELGHIQSEAQKPVLAPAPMIIINSSTQPSENPTTMASDTASPMMMNTLTPAKESIIENAAENLSKEQPSSKSVTNPSIKTEISEAITKPATGMGNIVTFKMKFHDKAWVQVSQKDGSITWEKLNEPGTEKILSGVPPLSLTIGNARHVQLEYKGKMLDLAPYTREEVAHVTLE